MTEEEVFSMAVKCYLISPGNREGFYGDALIQFAKLVAEAEREACAKILDANAMACHTPIMRSLLQANATAIRARGQA